MDQKFEDVVMECSNCHLEFYAAHLRPEPQSNLMMCVNCLSLPGSKINILKDRPLKKNRIQVKEPSIPRMSTPSRTEQAPKANIPAGFSHFRCTSCRYEFSRKNGFSGNCPYCAKKSVSLVRAN